MMESLSKTKNKISLDDAKKMTKKFRENKDKVVKDQFKSKHVLPVCETFDRGAFDDLLSNPAVKGLRVYFGMTDDDQVNVIIVGVDEGGKDMLPSAEDAGTMRLASQDAPTDPIIENGVRCPTTCPPPSALNGGV